MRTIEILITDPLYAKLVVIAAKASGQDKPTDQQVANTLAGLAQHSLDRAFAQVSTPEPVTKPIPVASDNVAGALAPPIINRAVPIPARVLLLLVSLALLAPGCMVARYERIPARCECAYTARLISRIGDGPSPCSCSTNQNDAVRFRLVTFLVNEKVAKVSVDKFTGKTHSGIVIGTAESTVDDGAVQAITAGVIEGVVKGLK